MFHGTLLHKCVNIRYQKQQTKNTYFQENVHYSPLAVKMLEVNTFIFQYLPQATNILFSYIPSFYQWTVLEVGEYKTIAPTKSSGPVFRSTCVIQDQFVFPNEFKILRKPFLLKLLPHFLAFISLRVFLHAQTNNFIFSQSCKFWPQSNYYDNIV